MPGATKWGTEFLVNTTTQSDQSWPSTTALPDGRFVVTWIDESRDPNGSDVRVQVFNADGSKSGGELPVNTTIAGSQDAATIVSLTDGRFVVAWTDDYHGIRAQMFESNGAKAGGEIVVSADPARETYDVSLVARPDGGFIVSWSESNGDGDSYGAVARAYSSAGTPWASKFPLNTTVAGEQFDPAIASLPGGGFVAVWTDSSGTNGDTGHAIRAQLFAPNGHKVGGEFLANTTTSGRQDMPAVETLAGGGFVVTWRDVSNGLNNAKVRGQVFNENGTKHGGEFPISAEGSSIKWPAVTALADGRFVVTWEESAGQLADKSDQAIHARLFNANGTPSGEEFIVNTTTNDGQRSPTVAALADGRLVFSWFDQSKTAGDESGDAVRAQIFDPREKAVSVAGTDGNDDFVGTRFADAMAGGKGNDRLAGMAGNDTLDGGDGNDFLDGGAGADTMRGGTGNDIYVVDNPGDRVIESPDLAEASTDTVLASVSHTLAANVERLVLTGNKAIDGAGNQLANRIDGNAGSNRIDGKGGADSMAGGRGADTYIVDNTGDKVIEEAAGGTDTVVSSVAFTLPDHVENLILAKASAASKATASTAATGNDVVNVITGNAADNLIAGKAGSDILTGGDGKDRFLFDTALDEKANLDRITDFAKKKDKIILDADIFAGLDLGRLDKDAFLKTNKKKPKAKDAEDHVLYSKKTGAVFLDEDGKGGAKATTFAILDDDPNKLSHKDFLIEI